MSKLPMNKQTVNDLNHKCSKHVPELNPLMIPLSKVCYACGATETLSRYEASWPSILSSPHAQKHAHLRLTAFAIPAVVTVAILAMVTEINNANWNLTKLSWLAQTEQPLKREPHRPLPSFSQLQQGELSPSSAFQWSAQLPPSPETHDITQPRENVVTEARITTSISPALSSPSVASEVEAPDQDQPQIKNLEKRITKAIFARAVYGVSVSFSNNVVNLEGTVKTDNQKTAAEQAARRIIGTRALKNSIIVAWPQENG